LEHTELTLQNRSVGRSKKHLFGVKI
jgi:hypothetical protein